MINIKTDIGLTNIIHYHQYLDIHTWMHDCQHVSTGHRLYTRCFVVARVTHTNLHVWPLGSLCGYPQLNIYPLKSHWNTLQQFRVHHITTSNISAWPRTMTTSILVKLLVKVCLLRVLQGQLYY